MNRALLLLVLPSFLAFAEDAPCKPAPANSTIEVSLKKGAKLKDLAAWYRHVTCRELEAPLSAADAPIALTLEGKVPAGRVLDVLRAAAGSAGYEVRDELRKVRLQKAPEPCDAAKASALLAKVSKASTCALDLEVFGAGDCIDTRVTLEDVMGKVKVKQLAAGSLLHALGLREGDELVGGRAGLQATPGPTFELEVLRAGTAKTLHCELSGESPRLHPITVLREALAAPPGLACALDSSAITTKGDVVEIDASKSPALELDCFLRATRIVPSIRDGKTNGLRLYAIRPNTLLARLGFLNGDTLKSINGYEVTSPEKALEVYSRLRTEKKFKVELERHGSPTTITIVLK